MKKNLYGIIKRVVKKFTKHNLKDEQFWHLIPPEEHLINVLDRIVDGYSKLCPEYLEDETAGLLITSNRIVSIGDPARPTRIVFTTEDNTFNYAVRTTAHITNHNVTIMKNKQMLIYRIVDALYPGSINSKYQVSFDGLTAIQNLLLAEGYFPIFDPFYIAIFPIKYIEGAEVVNFSRRFESGLKSLQVDADPIQWLPLFLTESDDENIITPETVGEILEVVKPGCVNIELDKSFVEILSRYHEKYPELKNILLQLML